jgi:hypothetical protein
MDGIKLWETIKPYLQYPNAQKNITGTQVGSKFAMDVSIIAGGSGSGGPALTEIVSGVDGPVQILTVGGIKSLAVAITDLVLDHLSDSVSIGANGSIVSDANPLPTKTSAPTIVTATSTTKTANYTEPSGSLNLTIVCDVGSLTLQGGRVLTAGESVTFNSQAGYLLGAFTVTLITGSYTINVVR